MTPGVAGFVGWAITLAVAAAVVALGVRYMVAMPGHSHAGPPPPLTSGQRVLAERLRGHVAELAQSQRNLLHPLQLERGARYVETALVVGAHYDTVPGSPGANDNASAVAVLLELARLLADDAPPRGRAIRFVAFVNEEPPFFMSAAMGSEAWARRALPLALW
jgi:hypothetical protein